ncbi:hypothetical protein RF11_05425 [Thelohanellus kitauei]|uniref:Uncharacterized protein n=1 Tax=Thelohanellus kitauei TaxID=669202 RepID=A0A0C2MMQ2_THEKT|nr:hypothetical protein RF11_05425 [Thelohanellus kitauei]
MPDRCFEHPKPSVKMTGPIDRDIMSDLRSRESHMLNQGANLSLRIGLNMNDYQSSFRRNSGTCCQIALRRTTIQTNISNVGWLQTSSRVKYRSDNHKPLHESATYQRTMSGGLFVIVSNSRLQAP